MSCLACVLASSNCAGCQAIMAEAMVIAGNATDMAQLIQILQSVRLRGVGAAFHAQP